MRPDSTYAKLFGMQCGDTTTAYLSLGSNLGTREENLRGALELLDRMDGIRVGTQSDVIETEPWGVVDQPQFLNMAVEIGTELAPLELLNAVKSIERRLGREPGTRWGPRLIDIDIIMFGDTVLESPELTLPHKRFRERAFVLAPLAQIAGDVVDPITKATISKLAVEPEVVGNALRIKHIGSD